MSEDTLIYVLDKTNSQLVAKPLSELAEICSFNVLSMNLETNKTEVQPAIISFAGMKKVIKLTTENGRVIEASTSHNLYTVEKGKLKKKSIDNIKVGDELACLKE